MGNSGSSTKEIPAYNISSMSNKTNYYGISIQSFVNYKHKKRDLFDYDEEEDDENNNYWIFIIIIIILLLFLLLILYLNKNI
jgi:uncharacterized integral membrane protein